MKRLVILSSLLLAPAVANASFLALLDPKNFDYKEAISDFLMKQLYKRAKKPEDVNVIYDMGYQAFSTAYRDRLATDVRRCDSISNNPAWIDGAKIPTFNDAAGVKVFTIAENSSYVLAQRGLSKRGAERLRKHWFNFVISESATSTATIIQNLNAEDAYTTHKFKKNHPWMANADILVFNTVLSEELVVSFGLSGSLDPNFTPIDVKLNDYKGFNVTKGQGIELSHCDKYKVRVISNTAPIVSNFSVKKETANRGSGIYYKVSFVGEDKETTNDYLNISWQATTKNGNTIQRTGLTADFYEQLANEIVKIEVIASDGDLAGKYAVDNIQNIKSTPYSGGR